MSTMKTIGRKAFSFSLSLLLAVCLSVQIYGFFILRVNTGLSLEMFLPASFLAYAITRMYNSLVKV